MDQAPERPSAVTNVCIWDQRNYASRNDAEHVAQAGLLQDMARGGNSEAVSVNASLEAYKNIPNPQTQHATTKLNDEDIHPVALLESLATLHQNGSNLYGQTTSDEQPYHDQLNDQFNSLLQAAATAESQHDMQFPPSNHAMPCSRTALPNLTSTFEMTKRKRPSNAHSPEPAPSICSLIQRSSTRRKKVKEQDPNALARERLIWGSDGAEGDGAPITSRSGSHDEQSSPASEALAAAVRPAVVLFRKPTAASERYTRPPMSKLFTSLELTAEQFVHIQAAAKVYMLDPEHPDRANCVGSRGATDTDMVKLKLVDCVNSFLENEGWGQKLWGAGPDYDNGLENRRLRWPQMRSKIITLVMPLMRRMVTNERQRVYAKQTRAAKASTPRSMSQGGHDPTLVDHEDSQMTEHPQSGRGKSSAIQYRVNFVLPGDPQSLLYSTTLSSVDCPVYSSLLLQVRSILAEPLGQQVPRRNLYKFASLKALIPTGLVAVDTVDEWDDAVQAVTEAVWMEGIVRVVVQVEAN